MIPQPLERQALQKLRDDSNAGHLGFFKTYQRVHRRYFLQRLYSAVFKYVNPRQVCQRRKNAASLRMLQRFRLPLQPFERVGKDLHVARIVK